MYEDGSALRHMATIKELFATHLALLWMAVKHQVGALRNRNLGEDEKFKLNFIVKSVKSLVTHQPLLEQLVRIQRETEGLGEHEQPFEERELQRIMNSFEKDEKPADDQQRLAQLQELYKRVHRYFMQKAGNYEVPEELAQADDDFLFKKEVE